MPAARSTGVGGIPEREQGASHRIHSNLQPRPKLQAP